MKTKSERNTELTLDTIRADIDMAGRELHAILSEIDVATASLAEIRNQHQAELTEMELRRMDLNAHHRGASEHEEASRGLRDKTVAELSALRVQIKDANRALNRLNQWIISAQAESVTKQSEIASLDGVIAEKKVLADGIEALRSQSQLEAKRLDAIRLDSSLAADDAQTTLDRIRSDAEIWLRRRGEAEAARDQADNERDAAIKEKDRIVRDLSIYIGRVEAKYQEAFPDLHMIL